MKHLLKNLQITFLISSFFILITSCEQKKEEVPPPPKDFTWTTNSDEALKNFVTGLAFQDVNDNVSSRKYMDAAIAADANFAIAYVFRSFSSGSTGEFKADTDKAASLIASVSDGEKALIKINQTYLNNDNAQRINLFKQLTDSMPESARAWYFLAFEQNNRNEIQAARDNFDKAQKLDSSWVGGYSGAGSSYLFSEPKDFAKGQSNFETAIEIGPQYAFNHINLGDAYRAQNDLESASASYSKALEVDPQHFIAYTKRGHANSFLGNYDEARMDFQTSREFNEYGNQAFTFEAFTYLYEGDVDKGLSWLEEQAMGLESSGLPASRIASGKLSCANNCAWIAFHHGKLDHLERLSTMRNEMNLSTANEAGSPAAIQNAKSQNALWDGMTAALKGEYEEASSKAEETKNFLAESTNPNKLFNYYFLKGYISYQQGNYAEAEQSFRKGSPNWVYNSYFLGKTLEAAGKIEEANAILQKAAIHNFNSVFYALIRNELGARS